MSRRSSSLHQVAIEPIASAPSAQADAGQPGDARPERLVLVRTNHRRRHTRRAASASAVVGNAGQSKATVGLCLDCIRVGHGVEGDHVVHRRYSVRSGSGPVLTIRRATGQGQEQGCSDDGAHGHETQHEAFRFTRKQIASPYPPGRRRSWRRSADTLSPRTNLASPPRRPRSQRRPGSR